MKITHDETMKEKIFELESIIGKEIAGYQGLLDYEYKKMNAILDNRLQDIDLYCDYQQTKMKECVQLAKLRKERMDAIVNRLFPHLLGRATLKDVLHKLPLPLTVRLASLRIELNARVYKLKKMNDLIPRLLEQGLEIYKTSKEFLKKTKKIGYNSKGKEQSINEKLALLVNRQV